MKRYLIFTLILPLVLALLLAGCNFNQVKPINLSFYVDGEAYTTVSLSTYRKEGVSLPTREGYTLTDWYLDAELTQAVVWDKITQDTSLYAKWERPNAKTYLVTFYDESGEILSRSRVTSISEIRYPEVRDADKRVFDHWDGVPRILVGDVNIYAVYSDAFQVTFWVDGEIYSRQKVKSGESALAPANPTKPADAFFTYAFTGWDHSFDNVRSNLDIKANFRRSSVEYDIVFAQDDGTEIKRSSLEYGDRIALPADPVKAPSDGVGYTFAGWDVDGDGKPDEIPSSVTKSMTAVAVYDTYTMYYTVIFMSDGVELYRTQVEHGYPATYEGEEPVRARDAQYTYTFDGWDADLDEILAPVTVNARFAEVVNRYRYAFLDEDGEVYVDSHGTSWAGEADYGSEILAPDETPEKEMTVSDVYTFDGWKTEEGVKWKEEDVLTGDVTYQVSFATTARKYEIVFSVQGHVYDTVVAEYGAVIAAPIPPEPEEPAQEGHHWECVWINWTDGYIVTRNAAFAYSCEEVIDTFTITWMFDEDTVYHVDVLEYGADVVAPSSPYRDGYAFAGWAGFVSGNQAYEDATYVAQWSKL